MSGETLIEKVVALEAEADRLLKQAQEQAQHVLRQADAAVAAEHERLHKDLSKRVAAFRAEAEQQHQEDMRKVQARLQKQLDYLGQLDEPRLAHQAEQILSSLAQD
jgi:vacuolar-type H+-ATPase subunit H